MTRPKAPTPVVDNSDRSWHLDRKVPIALILAIFVQTVGFGFYGGVLTQRISVLEEKASVAATQPERLARVEEKLAGVQTGIAEIKALLQPRIVPGGR